MWVEKLTLKNIKCFEHTEIVFTSKNRKKPHRWVTLLGQNGVGKTTFLQALGLLLAGPQEAAQLLLRPQLDGWVRDPSKISELSTIIHKEEEDTWIFEYKKVPDKFEFGYFITSDKLEVEDKTYTGPTLIEKPSESLKLLRGFAFHPRRGGGWFAAGYGAFRRLTRENQGLTPSENILGARRAENFRSLFDEKHDLSSFVHWMLVLDFRLAKDPTNKSLTKAREIAERAINHLLPDNVRFAEITTTGQVLFWVDGQKVSSLNLSDGFRSVIALAGDLLWLLLQAFSDFSNIDDPTQAPGVVLIDELDAHLHPIWQRNIAGWLREVFPNLQFIVATHSPFIALGGGEDALTLLLEKRDGNIVIEPLSDFSAYDVDQLLRSTAFGLQSTHSPQAREKIKRYHELSRRREKLTNEEREEFKRLKVFMRNARPILRTPEPDSVEAEVLTYLRRKLP